MNIVYSSKIGEFTDYNSSFDRGVLRVCYVGKNRNNSFISKEVFERCMPSIYNCPIVCRYDRAQDEIGAHDMEVIRDRNDNLTIVNVTTPVGVIPESSRYWWEEVEEDDGTIHEYLCVDALLWKRQEAYDKIKEDGITDESMEITVLDGSMKDGVYVIDRFEFTAFCLLGTAEPCYESASLMMFSKEDFRDELNEMMREFKDSFSMVQPSQEVVINQQNNLEGGEKALDEKKNLMTQYGLTEEMLDFNLDDFSVEELTEKFEAMKINKSAKADPEMEFALEGQFREELVTALSETKIETCYGEENRYWLFDYDSELMEVYCYDLEDDWRLYGFTYSMNGDRVVIDYASKKRKKCAIVDFDEGEQPSAFASVYSMVTEKFAAATEEWSQKCETLSNQVNEMTEELTELREFKLGVEQNEDREKREQVFEQFEDLTGIEAFEAIRENCEKYSIEEIEEKCFAIRGRKHTEKFAFNSQKAPKLPVEKHRKTNEPYGGIFAEYGIYVE